MQTYEREKMYNFGEKAKSLAFIIISLFAFVLIFFTTLELSQFASDFTRNDYHFSCDKNSWLLQTLFINGALLLLFYLQHSGMALLSYKQWLYRRGLGVIERSLYILATAIVIQILLYYWQYFPCAALWHIDLTDRPVLSLFFHVTHIFMWILVYAVALTMDFAELVGLKQVYYHCIDASHPMQYKSLNAQKLYRHMRHGGIVCLYVIFWVHPHMTLARLLLVSSWTLYLLLAHRVQLSDHEYLCKQMDNKQRMLGAHMWE